VGTWHVVRVLAFAAILAELALFVPRLWPSVTVAGLVVAAASIWLRRAAVVALGRFYSVHVELRDGHELVDVGPYRHVRHPLYVSYLGFLLGLGLAANTFVALALVVLLVVPFLTAKICHEEEELTKQLGDSYREYRARVAAVLPVRRLLGRTPEPR
jgi:protein-S-isoprenylcysteine O-methyltransferase Ste14